MLPKARVGLSVLPIVNDSRVDPIVVSWRNGMLRRRLLSSDSPGPLLESSYDYPYGLMALTHRWQNRHRVPLNSVFPGWTFETAGTDGLLGFLFCFLTPQVRSLDGVARALLCVELKPCRLHVALLSRANCRICKRDVIALMKVVYQ
jgi:hypothetical protein